MTDNQAFMFLTKSRHFGQDADGGAARDVKIIMRNRRVGWWNILQIAWKLRRGVPVAKIIGRKWFRGLPFYTDKWTMDPRPDSETLVEAVLGSNPANGRGLRVLDLGTGTGCLVCSIVKSLPNATGVGIDKSIRACRVAKKNVKNLGLEGRIKIVRSSFSRQHGDFDIIVANPPYIPTGDGRVNRGARHDPKMALYGGADGLKFYRQIARLDAGPKIYLEIGAGQETAVKRIFRAAEWKFSAKYKDLSGRVRALAFSRYQFC
jgi:release factor glutamine methyltransferase